MQESEISMRKVKVLMGRGQELKEDDEVPTVEVLKDAGKPPQGTNGSSTDIMPSVDVDSAPQASIPSSQVDDQQFSGNSQDAPVPFQYLVNAAVVENENPNVRPYIDDILKLVVTLPVDGQTQNVQFDFHLIEDDPVQVAKEMVKELGIPQAAVLEISETISGLARSARMKQDKHAARLQSLPTSVSPPQVPPIVPTTQVQSQAYQPGLQTESIQYAQEQKEQHLPNVQAVQPIVSLHQHVAQQAPATVPAQQQDVLKYQSAQHAVIQQSVQTLPIPVQQPTVVQDVHAEGNIGQIPKHANDVIAPLPHHPVAPIINDQQYFQQQNNVPHSRQVQIQSAPVSYAVPEPMHYQSQLNSHVVRAADQSNYYPQDLPIHHQQQHPLAVPLKDLSHSVPQVKSDLVPPIGRPPIQSRQRSGDSDKSSESRGNLADSDVSTQQNLHHAPQRSAQPQMVLHPTEPHMNVNDAQSTQAFHSTAATQSSQLQYKDAEIVPVTSNRSDFPGEALYESQLQRPYSAVVASNVDGQSTQSEGDSDDEDDVDVADELRKLDEDFQKNLERAKKVFVNRMDNLQRSQIEREAQHLKTLEKHEKERAEFEKRLAQETEQQQRRIEQLQREWDKKRETIAIQKKKQKDAPMSLNNSDPHSEMTLGHLRTISATSSNFSLSPAMSVHKHQESNGDKTQAIER